MSLWRIIFKSLREHAFSTCVTSISVGKRSVAWADGVPQNSSAAATNPNRREGAASILMDFSFEVGKLRQVEPRCRRVHPARGPRSTSYASAGPIWLTIS